LFSALPLILNSLQGHLLGTDSQRLTRKENIQYVERVMKILESTYDITDDILAYIYKISSFLSDKGQLGPLSMEHQPPNDDLQATFSAMCRGKDWVTVWCERFLVDPLVYLRLSKLLDWTLSRGQFPREDEICTLYVRLGINIQLYPSDFSIEMSTEITFPRVSHTDYLVGYGRKMSENASVVEGHEEKHSMQLIPSVVNFDEETTSGVDLSPDDEMIEIIWNTLGLPGSFSTFVND
jgi:hypothetical protein